MKDFSAEEKRNLIKVFLNYEIFIISSIRVEFIRGQISAFIYKITNIFVYRYLEKFVRATFCDISLNQKNGPDWARVLHKHARA